MLEEAELLCSRPLVLFHINLFGDQYFFSLFYPQTSLCGHEISPVVGTDLLYIARRLLDKNSKCFGNKFVSFFRFKALAQTTIESYFFYTSQQFIISTSAFHLKKEGSKLYETLEFIISEARLYPKYDSRLFLSIKSFYI